MRWAQTRGLPVRRIPGGKTATVYALKDELDRWASNQSGLDSLEGAGSASGGVARQRVQSFSPTRRTLLVAGLAGLGLAVGATALIVQQTGNSDIAKAQPLALPTDPALSSLYLQARDDWAKRTPESLTRAIAALETITREEPRFAPAHSSLADTYLLAREFSGMPDDEAFAKAKQAARASLAIDPNLAAAHRAMGFVEYWRENDPVMAGRAFRRALALEPNSAQTHFWYGNVLSDNGGHDAALRELSRARLLEPGSIAIQTDLAWAQWAAGMQTVARSTLQRLAQTNPDFAVIPDCLAIMALAEGDYAGHVAEFSTYARLRQDPALIAHAAEQERALQRGLASLQALMLSRAIDRAASDIGRNYSWPAFIASVANDRPRLLGVLQRAEAAKETWGSAGTTSRIRRRWADDREIMHLLDRRLPPSVE